jgi:predicted ArsR family transcriptional regulator
MTFEDSADTAPDGGPRLRQEKRKVTDARSLRALSHPIRLALLESLSMNGSMTATQVGEMIGESPTTCSFHLRQLAKYGYVEEAGGGKGRARPWQLAARSLHLSSAPGDAESVLAEETLSRMWRDRQVSRYQAWRQSRSSFPAEWRDAAGNSQAIIHLTAAELAQLNRDFNDMIDTRFSDRVYKPENRPADALPVEILLNTYPVEPPSAGPSASAAHPEGNPS